MDTQVLDDLFALSVADRRACGADQSEIRRLYNLKKRCKQILGAGTPLTVSQLAIKGDTVKELLGIAESAQIGRILYDLLDAVLEDPGKNNPQDLAVLVRRIGQN
jgi:hypothetical protein